MSDPTRNAKNNDDSKPGVPAIGAALTGVIALLAGLLAYLDLTIPEGTGMCLLASAIAFGLLANAVYRK
jgi:hypothetical protein